MIHPPALLPLDRSKLLKVILESGLCHKAFSHVSECKKETQELIDDILTTTPIVTKGDKMKRIGEVLAVLIMLALFLGPPALFGQWYLFTAFLVFGIIFGLIEWLAVAKTGKSISQKFWILSKENKTKAWIIIAAMFISWMFLLYHFAYKHLL